MRRSCSRFGAIGRAKSLCEVKGPTFALLFGAFIALAPGCSDDPAPQDDGATVAFDPEASFDPKEEGDVAFFDFPYPSDLRLTPNGEPDIAKFPNPGVSALVGLKKAAGERKGFPVVPAGYFRFTKALAPRDPEVLVDGGAKAPILLLDVDPASPERGTAIPVVAQTPNTDPYVPPNLLAIGARPGIVLAPKRKYAFVVTKGVGLEDGSEPAPPKLLAALARGETPAGAKGAALRDLYAPLWETLDKAGVARADVVGATVFTTGDVVAETSELGDRVLAAYQPELMDLVLEPDDKTRWPELCHVRATIVFPQFQKGTPKFDTEGMFEFGADGLPMKQRDERVPVSLAIPKKPMPAGGYPLIVYFHGSGGVARQHIDGGDPELNPNDRWPATVMAARGFAMAGSSLPISPERVPGAKDYDYINANNLVVVRDTFRQGIFESRMLLSALEKVRIPPAVIAGCPGPTLPAGEDAYRFAPNVHAQGQSMGGMYTNLVAASDPRIKLAVPTGAGGYWAYFLLKTTYIENVGGLLSIILKTPERMSLVHPAMQISETGIEAVDPIVSANRIAKRPLANHPVRPIYQPVGKDDSYFPTVIYDAMVLSYGHPRAGDDAWPTMKEAQKLLSLDTSAQYPVKENLTSETGAKYTGVAVQWATDGSFDSHGIYKRVPEIIHQYACFHETFAKNGVAVVSPPGPVDAPCAE